MSGPDCSTPASVDLPSATDRQRHDVQTGALWGEARSILSPDCHNICGSVTLLRTTFRRAENPQIIMTSERFRFDARRHPPGSAGGAFGAGPAPPLGSVARCQSDTRWAGHAA